MGIKRMLDIKTDRDYVEFKDNLKFCLLLCFLYAVCMTILVAWDTNLFKTQTSFTISDFMLEPILMEANTTIRLLTVSCILMILAVISWICNIIIQEKKLKRLWNLWQFWEG